MRRCWNASGILTASGLRDPVSREDVHFYFQSQIHAVGLQLPHLVVKVSGTVFKVVSRLLAIS